MWNFRDSYIYGCVKNIIIICCMFYGCWWYVRDLKYVLNSRNSDYISCWWRFYVIDVEFLYDKELFEKYLEVFE